MRTPTMAAARETNVRPARTGAAAAAARRFAARELRVACGELTRSRASCCRRRRGRARRCSARG
jgi:hypothetical protein